MNKNKIPELSSESDIEKYRKKCFRDVEGYFGCMIRRPDHLNIGVLSEEDFAAGHATLERCDMVVTFGEREYSVPFTSVIPNDGELHPILIHICDSADVPNKYQPTEELVEHGFAILSFDATDERIKALGTESPSAGMIARAAFIAMRIVDCAVSFDGVDTEKIAVIGHSMLGAAALLAAAYDERIEYAIANAAGIHLNTDAAVRELFDDVLARSGASSDYSATSLYSLIAPRHILIGCSEADLFASSERERDALYSVAPIYALLGQDINEKCHFHVRGGTHYLSRADYEKYLEHIGK